MDQKRLTVGLAKVAFNFCVGCRLNLQNKLRDDAQRYASAILRQLPESLNAIADRY